MYMKGGDGVSRLHMYAKKFIWITKSPNFFCTKEAITLPFIIVYRKT